MDRQVVLTHHFLPRDAYARAASPTEPRGWSPAGRTVRHGIQRTGCVRASETAKHERGQDAHGFPVMRENQRRKLQRRMQRSGAEVTTISRSSEGRCGGGSKARPISTSGWANGSSDGRRLSGGACEGSGAESSSAHVQSVESPRQQGLGRACECVGARPSGALRAPQQQACSELGRPCWFSASICCRLTAAQQHSKEGKAWSGTSTAASHTRVFQANALIRSMSNSLLTTSGICNNDSHRRLSVAGPRGLNENAPPSADCSQSIRQQSMICSRKHLVKLDSRGIPGTRASRQIS